MSGMPSIRQIVGALLIAGCAPATREPAPVPEAQAPAALAAPGRIEGTSLLGRPLAAPELAADFRAEQEALLARAEAELAADPGDPERIIWVGRRTAYLGRYREAIEIYSRGIAAHPGHAALYRHRGHRHITLRQLDAAVADLSRAAELIAGTPDRVEPDGLPNARNVPTSTSHSNVWYHLGLAHFLKGDFERAAEAYRECLAFSTNPDMLSATSHWLYMTLRRLGRDQQAERLLEPIEPGMDVIENRDYFRLLRMYQGHEDPARLLAEAEEAGGVGYATVAYGVGHWHLVRGERARAREIFRRIVDSDAPWAAFGYIAAEAELARSDGLMPQHASAPLQRLAASSATT